MRCAAATTVTVLAGLAARATCVAPALLLAACSSINPFSGDSSNIEPAEPLTEFEPSVTLTTVWIIAEVLCRLILGLSVSAAARELFGVVQAPQSTKPDAGHASGAPAAGAPVVEPNAALRRMLADRRRKLADIALAMPPGPGGGIDA